MARGLFALGAVGIAFWVYTIVDVLLTDRARIRAFSKPAWTVVVFLLPIVGGLIWLFVGKARRIPSSFSRPMAPDDDPTFLGTLNHEDIARRAEQDERLRRLEQELADLDDDTSTDPER